MLFLGIAFLFPTSPQTDVQDMNYTVVVLGGVMLLSLAWYYCPKYGGVHWFKGPIATVEGFDDSVYRKDARKSQADQADTPTTVEGKTSVEKLS